MHASRVVRLSPNSMLSLTLVPKFVTVSLTLQLTLNSIQCVVVNFFSNSLQLHSSVCELLACLCFFPVVIILLSMGRFAPHLRPHDAALDVTVHPCQFRPYKRLLVLSQHRCWQRCLLLVPPTLTTSLSSYFARRAGGGKTAPSNL